VIPAFAVGLVVPGIIARFAIELWPEGFFPWSHWIDWLIEKWAILMQSVLDGFCAVYFTARVAPRGRLAVALIAALILAVALGAVVMGTFTLGYWGHDYTVAAWPLTLMATQLVSAGAAVWYSREEEQQGP